MGHLDPEAAELLALFEQMGGDARSELLAVASDLVERRSAMGEPPV